MTDEALRYLETNKDRPFYLNFWLYSVHGPWQHKEAYTAQFAKKTDPRGKQRNPVMASMLRTVDESLGRLLAKLDELKLTDDTLFIFYSDNGGNCHSWGTDDAKLRNVTPAHPLYETIQSYRKWAGGEVPTNNDPLREGKGRIYEGGQRVPLLVRWPGRVQAGSTSGAVVGAIDLYPTVLDALGLPQPAGHVVDGVSFLPVLAGAGGIAREAYFTWFPHLIPAVSVRQGDWKLIRRFEPHPQYPEVRELYNLREDLGETKNLAPAMPEKVKELDALIDAFVRDTGALYPKPNPDYRPGPAAAAAPARPRRPASCPSSASSRPLPAHCAWKPMAVRRSSAPPRSRRPVRSRSSSAPAARPGRWQSAVGHAGPSRIPADRPDHRVHARRRAPVAGSHGAGAGERRACASSACTSPPKNRPSKSNPSSS